jgi:hypothetical protein
MLSVKILGNMARLDTIFSMNELGRRVSFPRGAWSLGRASGGTSRPRLRRPNNVARVIATVQYHFLVAVWRAKETESRRVKRYWEVITDNLSKAGWSWGCISTINSNGQTIFVADAHRGAGKR